MGVTADRAAILQQELTTAKTDLTNLQQQWQAEQDISKKRDLMDQIRRRQVDTQSLLRELNNLPKSVDSTGSMPGQPSAPASTATKESTSTTTRTENASIGQAAQTAYDAVMASIPALREAQNAQFAATANSVDLARQVLEQSAGVQYTQQKQVEQNQAQFNLSPDTADNAVVQAHQEMMDAASRHADALKRYNEAQKNGGNLLDALFGDGSQQVDAIGREVNAAADQYDNAKQVIADSLQLLNTQNTVTRAATSDAQYQLSLTLAKQKTAEAAGELARLQGSNITQMNQQLISAAGLEQHMLNSETVNMMKQEKLDLAKMKNDQYDALTKRLADYSEQMGYQSPITPETLDKRSPKEKQMILQWIERGTFGATPFEAMSSWSQMVGPNINTLSNRGQAGVVKNVQQIASQVTSAAARDAAQKQLVAENETGAKWKIDKATIAERATENYLYDVSNAASSLDKNAPSLWSDKYSSDVYNPFVLQIPAFIASLPALKANGQAQAITSDNVALKYATQILQTEPKDSFGNMSVDSQRRMLDTIAADVRAKKLDPAKAAKDIANFFDVGARAQYAAQRLESFNIEVPSLYEVGIPKSGLFGKDARFNMRNPADVQTYLLQRAAEQSPGLQQLQMIEPRLDNPFLNF